MTAQPARGSCTPLRLQHEFAKCKATYHEAEDWRGNAISATPVESCPLIVESCPIGQGTHSVWHTCELCPYNQFSSNTSVHCYDCPEGQYGVADRSECSADLCPPGFKVVNSECVQCGNGTTTTVSANKNEGDTNCVCDKGYYSLEGTCTECGQGTYQDEAGKTVCKACPQATTTNNLGAVSAAECDVVCPYIASDGKLNITGLISNVNLTTTLGGQCSSQVKQVKPWKSYTMDGDLGIV